MQELDHFLKSTFIKQYCSLTKDISIKIYSRKSGRYGYYKRSSIFKKPIIGVNTYYGIEAAKFTYIHEYAHHLTNINHKKATAHGKEWKTYFSDLLQLGVTNLVFLESNKQKIIQYAQKPTARVNIEYLFGQNNLIFLNELNIGEQFKFKNKVFVKKMNKRTRAVCQDLSNKKLYSIPQTINIDRI